ncbi:MAG: AAA family ATPase [Actinomycetota bacterium]
MTATDQVARIVLALEAPEVAEEVMHFLDRSGRARVVATAADDRQLAEAVRQLEPDAVVAEPSLLAGAKAPGVVFALDVRESVSSLRTAIRAGAAGYFLWPKERDELLGAAAAALRRARRTTSRGTVLAVHGGRGGAGVTFVATHLAAAFARRSSVVLIDADPVFGDVAQMLGAPAGEDAEPMHTFADAASLGDDLGPEQLRGALWRHGSEVDVLLPPSPEEAARLGPDELRLVTDAATETAEVVILHLPRALGPMTLAGAEAADRLLEVLTLDVVSFRASSRAMEAFAPLHLEGRAAFVVNRAARSEVTPDDVRRVFGEPAIAVFPLDRAIRSAQERGRLLPAKGRMARRFDRLADTLSEPVVEEMAS